jgi:tetratricopeptide (TPR) repeat protein
VDAAGPPAEESVAIYRELGDQQGLAEALTILGLNLVWQGEAKLSQARLEEALIIHRKTGDPWGTANALYRLGSFLADYNGDPAGEDMLEECAAILEGLGEKYIFTGVLVSLGIIDMGVGNYPAARKYLERSLAIAREIRHPWGMADALINLGCVCRIQGEYLTAKSHFEEAQRVYQEHASSIWEVDVLCALAENDIAQGNFSKARLYLKSATDQLELSGNKWLHALVSYFRGLLAYYEGESEEAAVLLEKTTAMAREGQYKPDLGRSLVTLGRVRLSSGEATPATKYLREGLDLFQELGHRLGVASAIEQLATVSALQDDGIRAARLFSWSYALREAMDAPFPPVDRSAYNSMLADIRAQLGEAAYTTAWTEGCKMTIEQAIDYAKSYPLHLAMEEDAA